MMLRRVDSVIQGDHRLDFVRQDHSLLVVEVEQENQEACVSRVFLLERGRALRSLQQCKAPSDDERYKRIIFLRKTVNNGIFGMNLKSYLEEHVLAFWLTTAGIIVGGIIAFFLMYSYLRARKIF
ncbi:hypothetical protein V8G54_026673 [Vigna mungo]|uniref:Uncharacterized protein n=1 Tax=Vigna mungo TaxID=3915 RepID=A0AAQ3RQ53_VIGMU